MVVKNLKLDLDKTHSRGYVQKRAGSIFGEPGWQGSGKRTPFPQLRSPRSRGPSAELSRPQRRGPARQPGAEVRRPGGRWGRPPARGTAARWRQLARSPRGSPNPSPGPHPAPRQPGGGVSQGRQRPAPGRGGGEGRTQPGPPCPLAPGRERREQDIPCPGTREGRGGLSTTAEQHPWLGGAPPAAPRGRRADRATPPPLLQDPMTQRWELGGGGLGWLLPYRPRPPPPVGHSSFYLAFPHLPSFSGPPPCTARKREQKPGRRGLGRAGLSFTPSHSRSPKGYGGARLWSQAPHPPWKPA